jgi:hypothetical protein
MPGPKAQVVVLAREDREKLERIERAATSEQREVLRARIIVQAAEAAPDGCPSWAPPPQSSMS